MTKKELKKENTVAIYQGKDGAIELRGDLSHETIWASQRQIADVFEVTTQNVTMHIKNIFKEGELSQKATCKESLQVQIEGNRRMRRKIKEYNLDVIIAVGYRISSIKGTEFRIWATKTLKKHLIEGYTINKKRVGQNYDKFIKAVSDVKALLSVHPCN